MKPKILYISFAILIIVIIISLLINRESAKIQSALEETNPQQIVTQQPSALSEETPQLPPAFDNRPAITIIKPEPKENPTPALEEKINKRRQPERLSASPSQSPAVPEIESEGQPVSGVTKIGKRPTEKEKQEMNARGIIMY
jgi:hypothetical protein